MHTFFNPAVESPFKSFACLKLSSWFSNRSAAKYVFLHLHRKHYSFVFVLQLNKMHRTLWIQNPAFVEQCVLQRPKISSVPGHPTDRMCAVGTSKSFWALSVKFFFKLPCKQLGSYEFCRDLLSRDLCWVPQSGSTPRWLPPSRAPRDWRICSVCVC